MSEVMINNTFRPAREDAFVLSCIRTLDPRCENDAAACRYAFANALKDDNFDFEKAAKYKPRNISKIDIDDLEYGVSKSYSIEKTVWDGVVNKFRAKYDVTKVRISYLTRLVTKAYLMKLELEAVPSQEVKVKIKIKTIDVELLQKVNNHAAELIKAGDLAPVLAFIGEDYNKPTEELAEEERWESIEEMTCNMDSEGREECLESWGDINGD